MLSFTQYLNEVYVSRSPDALLGAAATPFILGGLFSLPPEAQPPIIPDRITIPTPKMDVPIYDKNWDPVSKAISGAVIGLAAGAISPLRKGQPFKSLTPDEKMEKSNWWNDEPLPRENTLFSSSGLSTVGFDGRLGAEPDASMIMAQRNYNAHMQRIAYPEYSSTVTPDLNALDRIRNSKPIHHMTDEEAFQHGVDHALAMVRVPHESYGLPPGSPKEKPLTTSAHDSFHLGYMSAFDRVMTGSSFTPSFGSLPSESFYDPSERM